MMLNNNRSGMRSKLSSLTGRKRRNGNAFPRKYYILNEKTPFAVKEAYKTLRTNILSILAVHRTSNDDTVKFCFTSPSMGDGKTTVCVNVAVSFAETGARVLIIDADMRKPKIHKIFKSQISPGLSDCLSGFSTVSEAVVEHPDINGLYIMSAGKIPPNPAELILSDKFDALLKSLDDVYDYVIIDAPPVCVVTDAVIISKKTLGAVLICRYADTRIENAKKAKNEIEQGGGTMLGSVLNGVEFRRTFGSVKYESQYGYGYGYSDNTEDDE